MKRTTAISQTVFIPLLVSLSLLACNGKGNMGAGITTQNIPAKGDVNTDGNYQTTTDNNADVKAPEASEVVVIPTAITGAFLTCQEIPQTVKDKSKKQVGCALREHDSTQKNRNLSTARKAEWSFTSSKINFMIVSQDPNSATFQVVFDLSSKASGVDISTLSSEMLFKLLVDGKEASTNIVNPSLEDIMLPATPVEPVVVTPDPAPVPAVNLRWISSNNRGAPGNALWVGSEQSYSVPSNLCRFRYNGQLIPGKLQTDWNGGSICYGSVDGNYIQTNQNYYPSDVLVADGNANEVIGWVTATANSLPALAVQGGSDGSGRPVYICRSLQNSVGITINASAKPNAPEGELSPGYVKADGAGCTWQFYNIFHSNGRSFEVMVWKSEAIKAALGDTLRN